MSKYVSRIWYLAFRRGILVFFEKTKPIHRPAAGNPKHEALNPKQGCFNGYYFAKQSQFLTTEINVKCYLGDGYVSIEGAGPWKNKANLPAFGWKL